VESIGRNSALVTGEGAKIYTKVKIRTSKVDAPANFDNGTPFGAIVRPAVAPS